MLLPLMGAGRRDGRGGDGKGSDALAAEDGGVARATTVADAAAAASSIGRARGGTRAALEEAARPKSLEWAVGCFCFTR